MLRNLFLTLYAFTEFYKQNDISYDRAKTIYYYKFSYHHNTTVRQSRYYKKRYRWYTAVTPIELVYTCIILLYYSAGALTGNRGYFVQALVLIYFLFFVQIDLYTYAKHNNTYRRRRRFLIENNIIVTLEVIMLYNIDDKEYSTMYRQVRHFTVNNLGYVIDTCDSRYEISP